MQMCIKFRYSWLGPLYAIFLWLRLSQESFRLVILYFIFFLPLIPSIFIVVYGKDASVGEETNAEEEDAGSVSRIRQGRRAG